MRRPKAAAPILVVFSPTGSLSLSKLIEPLLKSRIFGLERNFGLQRRIRKIHFGDIGLTPKHIVYFFGVCHESRAEYFGHMTKDKLPYGIATEILYFQCFVTTDVFLFCKPYFLAGIAAFFEIFWQCQNTF